MSQALTVSNKISKKLTTPQLLKRGMYATWGTSLLLLFATVIGVREQRQAIKTVGKDATPSIITAQRLKDAMAGMDANAASELLVPSGQNPDAVKGYEERRQKAAERLVAAAENITFDKKERDPINKMQLGIGEYIAKIQQARDAHVRGDAKATLLAYRAAAEILDTKLIPAADALDKANSDELELSYAQQGSASSGALLFILFFGLLTLGVLVALQMFLSRRMRRTLNPMLLAASAIAFIFLGYTTIAFLSAKNHLKVAKEDAFNSMHALRQARALVYGANSDESRYLLDAQLASNHERAFFDKIGKVATLPQGATFETVIAESQRGNKVEGFTGYLADQLNNITFPGEREATASSLRVLANYVAIDQKIRQLKQSGKLPEAIALCIGGNTGESNWAFKQFLDTNQKNYDINDNAFKASIEQGFQDVEYFEIKAVVVTIAIASLTLFGLRPRLKEYDS
jgi:hypothetical protein